MLAYYSSETPVPAARKKKLRNSYVETPQADAPTAPTRSKHLSLLSLSVSSPEGGGSGAASPISPGLSVAASPGSGSPPQRPPLPAGYGSLGRGLKKSPSNDDSPGTTTLPCSNDSGSTNVDPRYLSLDRGSKPKRPAPPPQLSPSKRTAPSPPVVPQTEVNNNTLSERPLSPEEVKNRMLHQMLDPE